MEDMSSYMTALERVMWRLRALYEGLGYAQYPMRRFEQYDLYLENKAFLKGESVLAFPSPDGRMLALKPDVTLSIVKHTRATKEMVEKLYYTESVFRAEKADREFREIEQMGVEYLGRVDAHAALEVVSLAQKSLALISDQHVLELGHMGFVGGLLEKAGLENGSRERVLSFVRQKNAHELSLELDRLSITGEARKGIEALPTLCGECDKTLEKARALCVSEEMRSSLVEIEMLASQMQTLGLCDTLRLDFSIVNDMNYYTGLVLRGYVKGAPRAVLSGGRYDRLMARLGKLGDGVGFALYLDEFARLLRVKGGVDIDTLVLYDDQSDAAALQLALDGLIKDGGRVLAARAIPCDKRIGRVLRFTGNELKEVRTDA